MSTQPLRGFAALFAIHQIAEDEGTDYRAEENVLANAPRYGQRKVPVDHAPDRPAPHS